LAAERPDEKFVLTSSRHFCEWLDGACCSLAFTTYQAGKLFLLGLDGEGRGLSVFERNFSRSMGLGVSGDGRSFALATQYQIHRFDNVLPVGERRSDGLDAVYVPHASWVTGDLDSHDVGLSGDRPIFVNTLFSCLATVSDGYSFKPLWRPPFISRLAAEDRCHLNGLAVEDGVARYVTAVSRSDVADGWRDRRSDGGVVIDVGSGEIVAQGLSMPHSPRLYRGRLWLLNSGSGEFGYVELDTGRFEAVAFCPGYARGLGFAGDRAIIGLSRPRENRTFAGLALDDALRMRDTEPRCGLIIVNLESGDITDWVRIEGVVQELYDVAVIPRVRRPSLIGFKGNEIRYVISIEE